VKYILCLISSLNGFLELNLEIAVEKDGSVSQLQERITSLEGELSQALKEKQSLEQQIQEGGER